MLTVPTLDLGLGLFELGYFLLVLLVDCFDLGSEAFVLGLAKVKLVFEAGYFAKFVLHQFLLELLNRLENHLLTVRMLLFQGSIFEN